MIGARCESLWRDAWAAGIDAVLAESTRKASQIWAKAREIPVPDRAEWIRTTAAQDYLSDVRAAIHEDSFGEDAGYADGDPVPRLIQARGKRPKNRKKIIAQVASETGETKRMVETCWKALRRFERDFV